MTDRGVAEKPAHVVLEAHVVVLEERAKVAQHRGHRGEECDKQWPVACGAGGAVVSSRCTATRPPILGDRGQTKAAAGVVGPCTTSGTQKCNGTAPTSNSSPARTAIRPTDGLRSASQPWAEAGVLGQATDTEQTRDEAGLPS